MIFMAGEFVPSRGDENPRAWVTSGTGKYKGLKGTTGMWYWLWPDHLEKPEVPEGVDYEMWLGPTPYHPFVPSRFNNWNYFWDTGGGTIIAMGCHYTDIAQWGLGMDKSGPVEIVPPENPALGRGVKYIYENGIEVIHGGPGELVCCGEAMKKMVENTVDAAKEKHVPVIEKIDGGVKVKVGDVAHPMEEKHYIEWIEIIADGKADRQFLNPGETPEA